MGFFLLLGILLFFDTGLLAIGNLFCIAGLILVIGVGKSTSFFVQPEKLKGSGCFFGEFSSCCRDGRLLGWQLRFMGLLRSLEDSSRWRSTSSESCRSSGPSLHSQESPMSVIQLWAKASKSDDDTTIKSISCF